MYIKSIKYISLVTCLIISWTGISCDTHSASNELPGWDQHNRVPDFLDLELNLEIGEEIKRGNDIVFTLTMTNTGTEDLIIEGGDGPESFAFEHPMGYHDFVITDSNNTLYWRFHHPPNVTVRDDRGHTLVLRAGESVSSSYIWDGKDMNGQVLRKGHYFVTGLYEFTGIKKNEQVILGHPDIAEKGAPEYPHFTTEPKGIVFD